MDRRNVNNEFQNTPNTFEYSFPICDDTEEDENVTNDSNKSTPYYTPMEYSSTSFEFPSPKLLEKGTLSTQEDTEKTLTGTLTKNAEQMNFIRQIKQTPTATSPAVSRKLCRFSLNERRSISPQYVLTKNVAGSVDLAAINPTSPAHDKENAIPAQFSEQRIDEHPNIHVVSKSGNNSPIILKDECSSPKILATNFSPKLLASINNLKLTNSPLISSAGYKNGNYFKFPEIDNFVQDQSIAQETTATAVNETSSPKSDNQMRNISTKQSIGSSTQIKSRLLSNSLDTGPRIEHTSIKGKTKDAEPELHAAGLRKNRKNKNNLTIKITNTLSSTETTSSSPLSPSPSPSPKPKTPTIKNTKEKALSLDSAAYCEKLSIVIQSGESGTHVSCDEIDSKANFPSDGAGGGQLRQRNTNSRDRLRPVSATTSSTSSSSPAVYRSGHKPSPLLHSSNTNLKTLPEFLTLVEFSNTSPKERDQYPYKQKSMDLPSSSTASSSVVMATTPVLRTKITNSSSGSLLQRRGSNHSLTLNLHGSCSNLVGSCRTGLSVSNYSLGSVANSTTNLNAMKSSCAPVAVLRQAGPEVATATTLQPTTMQLSSQGVKQSLFRRRGSNQSLSLKSSATTSCGNLNTFTSQNSLYVDRMSCMQLPGVTRTTSFITPTQNTASASAHTPKRGLLERRGSNQNLTLHMSSFGGIGGDHRQTFLTDEPPPSSLLIRPDATKADANASKSLLPPPCCAQHHRKFFSSENLNKPNTQFSDLSENHRNVTNRPFGSASDLKVSSSGFTTATVSPSKRTAGQRDGLSVDFAESNECSVCTCSGIRNIMTRPLSPQRKAEEFKIYLANIQTLQNASNVLKQHDLIKLNYIFDNSYASNNSKSLQEVLPIVLSVDPSSGSKESGETPPSSSDGRLAAGSSSSGGGSDLVTTSEDSEVTKRYEEAVRMVLDTLSIDIDQQKRIFCDLHKEFWDLPLNHQEKPLVFGSQTKNRYKTILPNETTRVLLQNESLQLKAFDVKTKTTTAITSTASAFDAVEKISSNVTGNKLLIASTETPYINANYIKGPDSTSYSYVATQGPLPNTIFDFWLMVFQNIQNHKSDSDECALLKDSGGISGAVMQQYYQKIVMLTNFLEHHRQKCAVYFPVELNEIFIAASKQEVVPNNEHLIAFFDNYLQGTLAKAACGDVAIENFEVHELSEQVRASLPPAGNVFVIKNVGIVRKNGFSIRKVIGLYCLMKPAAAATSALDSDDKKPQMILKRFCCFHYWYPDWPDHRSPRDINTLLDISLHILNLGKCEAEFESTPQSPLTTMSPPSTHINAQQIELYQHDLFNVMQPYPIIHCSAGVGRTGCLTAILNGVRQMRLSLAYSLSSMAADVVSKSRNANLLAQPLSPIDFRLPTEFFDALPTDELQLLEYNNDTDSSFTRNTLLYIRFIAQKYKNNTKESTSTTAPTLLRSRPSLAELPRMPDIIVDILGIVCNLRLSRGGMVQNSEQYELIHRALCLYLKRTFALKRF